MLCEKTSKVRKIGQRLQFLPPANEAFKGKGKTSSFPSHGMVYFNGRWIHVVDSTDYVWKRDDLNKVLLLVGVPPDTAVAPN